MNAIPTIKDVYCETEGCDHTFAYEDWFYGEWQDDDLVLHYDCPQCSQRTRLRMVQKTKPEPAANPHEEVTSEVLSLLFGFGIAAHSPLETIEKISDLVFPLYSKNKAEPEGESNEEK